MDQREGSALPALEAVDLTQTTTFDMEPHDNPGLMKFSTDFLDLGSDAEFFVTARLFDGTPAIWPRELSYIQWRHEVATELGVDPIGIQLVGSARLGYSISPDKGYKLFNEASDLDIAVVSPGLFDGAWAELSTLIEGPKLDGQKANVRKLVFEECIALDIVLPHLTFGRKWSAARERFVRHLGPGFETCEVNYRVYRSHSALPDTSSRVSIPP